MATETRTYTYFMLLKTRPAWLAMTRPERRAFRDQYLTPVFERYPSVKTRFFDAEAFTGRCSDLMMFETRDPREYHFLIDALRDTPVFGVPYFDIVDVIPGVEDGYLEYDRAQVVARV